MTDSTTPETQHTTARYFLEGLQETGIHYLFSNLGTDHVTLIDEMARLQAEGQAMPEVVLCPHENVAIHMAGGYAAVTGQGQGVMVHVDAGTANAAMGMHNLMRARLPVLLMAGKAPYALHGEVPGARDNYVHYVQDPFDIASLVRPYVKWDYNLPSGVVAKEVVRRAHSVMHTEPAGPVYMTLPRETLAESWPREQVKSYPAARYGAVRMGALPFEATLQIARELMAADNPLVITSYLGRKPEAVQALEALAELCGIRVVEFSPTWLCISRESPCFFGFDATPLLPDTDWGLLLDIDVPWLPHQTRPREDTRWVHIDVDPINNVSALVTFSISSDGKSMPLGGGDIGANVWVEKGDLYFYFSRSGTFDEHNTLLKLGRVKVSLSPNPFKDSEGFQQELVLKDGCINISQKGTKIKPQPTKKLLIFTLL